MLSMVTYTRNPSAGRWRWVVPGTHWPASSGPMGDPVSNIKVDDDWGTTPDFILWFLCAYMHICVHTHTHVLLHTHENAGAHEFKGSVAEVWWELHTCFLSIRTLLTPSKPLILWLSIFKIEFLWFYPFKLKFWILLYLILVWKAR